MERTLKIINDLEKEGVIANYALGGATALLFYAEPALTYDIDVFIFLPGHKGEDAGLIDLGPLYRALSAKGFQAEKEHIMIEGIPVQFIPAYNILVEEAVQRAAPMEFQGVLTRVVGLEHLLAIMLQTDRPKDRERAKTLATEQAMDRKILGDILDRHALRKKWEETIGGL